MSLPRLLLESLEPRIAPAVIYAGPVSGPGSGTTLNPVPSTLHNTEGYSATSNGVPTQFHLASSALIQSGTGTISGFNSVSGSLDANYYIALKAGDTLVFSTSSGSSNPIKVSAGAAEVFFTDYNGDGIPEINEITGISLTAGAKITMAGLNVNGDIVDNLIAKTLSNPSTWTISADNLISNKQSIASLSIGGNVGGSIIAGGSISNVNVGIVSGTIQTGLTADTAYTFGGAPGVGVGVLTQFGSDSTQGNGYLPAAKLTGASLSNITLQSAVGIYASGGGAGGAGGSISNVTIISDATGIIVQGGAGGSAGTGSGINGGAGGSVSQVVMSGVPDSTNNDLIQIAGGIGGDALSGNAGTGGNGGAVSKIWVGYDSANQNAASNSWLHNDITVQGGNGGAGATAGNGGSVTGTTLLTATPLSAPGAIDIQVLGGDGGTLFAAGKKAGSGGSVTTFNIQDHLYTDPNTQISSPTSTVYVAGGDASAADSLTPVLGVGAAGGSVTNSATLTGQLVGQSFIFQGGNGSNTQSSGGAGGSVSNLQFGGDTPDEYLQSLIVNSGTGGSAFTGNGGAGGSISGISAPIATLSTLSLVAGSGGESLGNGTTGGLGGAGGSINSTNIGNFGTATYVEVDPLAGSGGDGFKGGGAGGSIQNFKYVATNDPADAYTSLASLVATAGDGGSVLGANGNGGAGGALSNITFSAQVPDDLTHTQTANLNAGFGGDGAGTGSGGAGGSIIQAGIKTQDAVNIIAGNGGSAGGVVGKTQGKIGVGGSIGSSNAALGLSITSLQSSVSYLAGDAGGVLSGAGTPSAGAAGGSILNATAYALGNISFQAGSGSIGGNGGNISSVTFDGPAGVFGSTGTISVIAGAGGDAISATTTAGRGGNVNNASGDTSTDTTAADAAIFQAGAGGSGGKVGGAGGSFIGLSIADGLQGFSVQAGDGGSGTSSGGVGGSVTTINSSAIVVVDSIAAGNGGSITSSTGGSLTVKGALGGSVTNLNVAGDIGIRTDENYGFATDGSAMGGIFAGTGGVNNNVGAIAAKTTALAGNVTSITAQAISAIVAGRAASPQLVNVVSGINLTGNTAVLANSDGSFANFTTANLVGGKAGSPATPNAVDFELWGNQFFTPSGSGSSAWTLGVTDPLDGLIAALTLTANRNFTPLAFLTTDPTQTLDGGYGLYLPPVTLA